jgi:hypothetical protein
VAVVRSLAGKKVDPTGLEMPNTETNRQPTEIYLNLREVALGASPADIGIAAEPKPGEPYGILMEMGWPEATVTLISFASGDASLYFSTGGGMLGGGAHESVTKAAKRFVSLAGDYIDEMEAVSGYPLPAVGKVRFYALTPQGILALEADEQDLGRQRSEYSPLFYAGQDVITELQIISEKGSDQ